MLRYLLIILCLISLTSSAHAQLDMADPKQFIEYNPDGQKYEFVKFYVMALGYLYRNEEARQQRPPVDEKNLIIEKFVADNAQYLLDENVNLRIARNILARYGATNNRLILKAIDLFKVVCDAQIDLNNQERELFNSFLTQHKLIPASSAEITQFLTQQRRLSDERKTVAQQMLEASALVAKVLVSPKQDSNGEFSYLGISSDERNKLNAALKPYSGENFTGELRPGQTYIEGSIALIRTVLDDKSYMANDLKK